MTIADAATLALLATGAGFFLAGTAGILRFPDLYSRLHALTKADTLGLGFIVLGLVLQADSVAVAAKLLAIWLLALVSGAVSCYLIASDACRRREPAARIERDASPGL